MVAEYVPDVGDLIKADFNLDQAGHEEAGWRPALVLSPKVYNKKTRLAVVLPITNEQKEYPFEVLLPAGQGICPRTSLVTLTGRSVLPRLRP